MSTWPADYPTRLSGETCALCAEGRPEETGDRIRFYTAELCDAYLHLRGVQRGYTAIVWRGKHAVEPTELSQDEAVGFWLEVLRVSRAMQTHYRPLKMNYQLMGNGQPHLHWLLAPRFKDDVAPGVPLPPSGYTAFPEAEVRRDARALGRLLGRSKR